MLTQVELERWEGYITSPFLVGDTFTMADAAVGPLFAQLKRNGLDMSKFPKIKSYLESMEVGGSHSGV